ncbi:MAG: recombination protein RecR [Bacteroidales bacterium]|nr:recombination protein RecR [Bacteroidales bacterium]
MNISSRLLENAVREFSKLPGIGGKTALRLVLHLLRQNDAEVEAFGNAIIELKKNIKYCKVCQNISDQEICSICSSNMRDNHMICVVENIRDIMAIENTGQYNGVYHVLGGIISPMDGIGPNDLTISQLIERAKNVETHEIILALSTTMEGDTTNFYIFKKLADIDVKVTIIARGMAVGGELEYTDEITLGRSIINRITYEGGGKLK